MSPVLPHHREARHVCRPVADVDHVIKRDRPQIRRHVVVHILRILQHPLVDPEQELRLQSVGNQELRKGGDPVMIEVVFGRVDAAEMPADRKKPPMRTRL